MSQQTATPGVTSRRSFVTYNDLINARLDTLRANGQDQYARVLKNALTDFLQINGKLPGDSISALLEDDAAFDAALQHYGDRLAAEGRTARKPKETVRRNVTALKSHVRGWFKYWRDLRTGMTSSPLKYTTFHTAIRGHLDQSALTLADLSRRTGISQSCLAGWFKKDVTPSAKKVDAVRALEQAFGVAPDTFVHLLCLPGKSSPLAEAIKTRAAKRPTASGCPYCRGCPII